MAWLTLKRGSHCSLAGLGALVGLLFTLAQASGCSHALMTPAPRVEALPHDQVERRESLDRLADAIFQAIRDRAPERVLAPYSELDGLLPTQARLRIERVRAQRAGHLSVRGEPWANASYVGFCAQGAREEPANGSLGLPDNAWVLDRLLVVASISGVPSAAWVEGQFVFTDQGWKVLSLERIEHPRARHADLELAPCDVERGVR